MTSIPHSFRPEWAGRTVGVVAIANSEAQLRVVVGCAPYVIVHGDRVLATGLAMLVQKGAEDFLSRASAPRP